MFDEPGFEFHSNEIRFVWLELVLVMAGTSSFFSQ